MSEWSKEKLHHLRNRIPITRLIADGLGIQTKLRDGHLRFLCPLCNNFNTATNNKTNLGRCFTCEQNFNPIDIVIAERKCSFRHAVRYLDSLVILKR